MSETAGNPYSALSAEALASLSSMEGVYEPIVEIRQGPADADVARAANVPGYVLSASVAALAFIAHFLPVWPFRIVGDAGVRHPVSAAILAILLGVVIRNMLPIGDAFNAGCKRIVKKAIPVAIVLMGLGLNLLHLATVGLAALSITIVSIVLAIAVAVYFGRMMQLGTRVAMLIGAGTGICGNSAIVAVAPLIDAEDEDLALSIGTINLFGLLAMLACPALGSMLHLGSEAYGVWAGTSIHAVPQVVAAGFAYGGDAGTVATAVKLVRVALLAPLMVVLTFIYARHHAADRGTGQRVIVHYARLVPWFVWGFAVAAALGTLGLVPTLQFEPAAVFGDSGQIVEISLVGVASGLGEILLTLAMAAIGLEVNIRALAGVSGRAVLTGLVASVALAVGSLGLIALLIRN